ncbi:MAG: flagellar hook protein FlgE [Firmicutes bacterium]|nr:flagellar hook protein FlgE [Bacillota bacterium]
MMRSMYSGVSGLKVHQTKMDVIGNNISNVNTIGFKGSKVTFSEVFSQTVRGASAPNAGIGGTNPQQIGLGASIGSIDVIHTKGSAQRTDNPTDLMIDGNGFFVLSNDANGQNRVYTRAGNFNVDKEGNLVASNGWKVLDGDMKPIQINKSKTAPAVATSGFRIKGNINSNDESYSTSVDIYDSIGDVHKLQVNIGKTYNTATTEGTQYMYREIEIKDENGNVLIPTTSAGNSTDQVYIRFNAKGEFDSIRRNLSAAPAAPDYEITTTGGSATGLGDPLTSTTAHDGNGDFTLSYPGVNPIKLTLGDAVFTDADSNKILSQTSQTSDAKGVPNDGLSPGTIESFTISDKGEVIAKYTNGTTETLATLGLADFDNPAGLRKTGSNFFVDTANSGTAKLGTPATGSFGALAPGALEMSNVDLSQEFTDMITTQRGFQANSKVISTSDEILQELVNLKR